MAASALSPYAPSRSCESQTGCATLPLAIDNQLKWMVDRNIVTESDLASQKTLDCLQEMGDAEALDALKRYERSFIEISGEDKCLYDFLSDLSRWLVGTWQGLEEGRDFGWIKKIGGGRNQRVWCHKREIEHILGLAVEEMVNFRVVGGTRGKNHAVDVTRMGDHFENGTREHELLWYTDGGQDLRTQRHIPPRLLLMTKEEVDVLKDFNLESQPVRDDAVEDCCFVEKFVRIPTPRIGLPAEDQIFSHPAFQHKAAQTELQELIGVKYVFSCGVALSGRFSCCILRCHCLLG